MKLCFYFHKSREKIKNMWKYMRSAMQSTFWHVLPIFEELLRYSRSDSWRRQVAAQARSVLCGMGDLPLSARWLHRALLDWSRPCEWKDTATYFSDSCGSRFRCTKLRDQAGPKMSIFFFFFRLIIAICCEKLLSLRSWSLKSCHQS